MYELLIALLILVALYFLWVKSEKMIIKKIEHFEQQKKEKNADWNEVIKDFAVDPEIISSHQDYTKNATVYSTGPSFTTVADDNTSPYFTNFVGFFRPEYVPVGTTARTVPDIDTSVLKRNFNPLHVPYY